MIYYLENQNLKIAVALKGAESKSVFNKVSQQELLWQADPEFWGKSSPVLFPIVGTLKYGKYIYQGKEYHLPRHGFARDYDFKLEEVKESQLIFSLEATAETLALYPFLFKLLIIYKLTANSLKVTYKVENLSGDETMFFSLGAHPAFNVGSNADDFSSYTLQFNKDVTLNPNILQGGLLTTDKNSISLNNKKLQLNYEMFENDALVLLDIKSDKITLLGNDDEPILNFEFENFPYFGIWTVKDSGFVCLEPWAGVADFEDHNQQLTDKFGINMLQPNEIWSASFTVTVAL
ncbi:Galactose mutarotase [Paenimyroides ummariense]|uniref:Galactose mutarotase n=1 Tax=Paenimyroides ummariense TaxID=913024 RepID=A0A1I5DVD8_9FLAO|nr:aldose 1-epimerase family protein [Paenimyroides ummariense]SFO03203.1 Galactose mutarotase [Paenimyroides ummariense]